MLSGQAKVSKLHGMSYKNQAVVLFVIECVWKSIWDGFWGMIRANFGSLVAFRSDFESKRYKVCKCGGVGCNLLPPPPTKIFSFGPQCEREAGRASQADVTPNGVGGFGYVRWMMLAAST